MTRLRPITPHELTIKNTTYGPQCPNCGALTVRAIVPCPDPPKEISPGVFKVCAAIHHGWRCKCCDTNYEEVQAPDAGGEHVVPQAAEINPKGGSFKFFAGVDNCTDPSPPACIELKENGDILVNGRLAENDKEVVEAMRRFLRSVGQLKDDGMAPRRAERTCRGNGYSVCQGCWSVTLRSRSLPPSLCKRCGEYVMATQVGHTLGQSDRPFLASEVCANGCNWKKCE